MSRSNCVYRHFLRQKGKCMVNTVSGSYGMGFANMGDRWVRELAQRLGHDDQEVSRRFEMH